MPTPPKPLIVAGKIYDTNGTTPIENARIWVYNKTNDEVKNAYDQDFAELTTNSAGEYMCNLANFEKDWNVGDEIWVSAYYEDKAQSLTFDLTGSPVSDKDLTLRNLEPAIAIMKLLRAKVSDPNTTRDSSTQMIKPKYSRRELTKSNYPIISIQDIEEISVDAGISSNKAEERTHTLLITIHIWTHQGDTQILTISGVNYEGTKLRDYLARKVTEALRKEFYQKPAYDIDAIVQKFYGYEKTRMESMPYDEEAEYNVLDKEIEIELKSINQET